MKHVRVAVTAGGREDEIHPMYDVMANAPYVEYATAINWNFSGTELGILHYVEGDPARFERTVEEIPEVIEYALTTIDERRFYVYIRDTTTPEVRTMFNAITERGLVTGPPIEYHPDGTATFSLFGPAERIQSALDAVPDPVTVTVEEISGLGALPQTAPAALSDRQREAIETALSLGYYEIPRSQSRGRRRGTRLCTLDGGRTHPESRGETRRNCPGMTRDRGVFYTSRRIRQLCRHTSSRSGSTTTG
jgi:hypothetical protein